MGLARLAAAARDAAGAGPGDALRPPARTRCSPTRSGATTWRCWPRASGAPAVAPLRVAIPADPHELRGAAGGRARLAGGRGGLRRRRRADRAGGRRAGRERGRARRRRGRAWSSRATATGVLTLHVRDPGRWRPPPADPRRPRARAGDRARADAFCGRGRRIDGHERQRPLPAGRARDGAVGGVGETRGRGGGARWAARSSPASPGSWTWRWPTTSGAQLRGARPRAARRRPRPASVSSAAPGCACCSGSRGCRAAWPWSRRRRPRAGGRSPWPSCTARCPVVETLEEAARVARRPAMTIVDCAHYLEGKRQHADEDRAGARRRRSRAACPGSSGWGWSSPRSRS